VRGEVSSGSAINSEWVEEFGVSDGRLGEDSKTESTVEAGVKATEDCCHKFRLVLIPQGLSPGVASPRPDIARIPPTVHLGEAASSLNSLLDFCAIFALTCRTSKPSRSCSPHSHRITI
jgi:hypothetical protein